MAKAVRGLGRGYDALIAPAAPPPPASEDAPPTPPGEVPIDRIDPSPWQPRAQFDQGELQALARSIDEQGLLVPLGVRPRNGRFELVHGERRFRALRLLERKTVPVVLMEMADAHVREAALVENLQRADLNPIETALAYQALLSEHAYTQEAMAARLGLTRQQVGNTLRLLNLPEEARRLVAEGQLSAGQAKALMALPDGASQLRVAKKAAEEGLSVREIERLAGGSRTDARSVARRGKGKKDRPAAGDAPRSTGAKPPDDLGAAAARDAAERLGRHLGAVVEIHDAGGPGKMIIHYQSPGDAARLLSAMGLALD